MENIKSRLTFDSGRLTNIGYGRSEFLKDSIDCEIPKLVIGEDIVLNAYGVAITDVHLSGSEQRKHSVRRLGIYRVIKKEPGKLISYTLQEEEKFIEKDLAHLLLSGKHLKISDRITGLKYIFLPKSKD